MSWAQQQHAFIQHGRTKAQSARQASRAIMSSSNQSAPPIQWRSHLFYLISRIPSGLPRRSELLFAGVIPRTYRQTDRQTLVVRSESSQTKQPKHSGNQSRRTNEAKEQRKVTTTTTTRRRRNDDERRFATDALTVTLSPPTPPQLTHSQSVTVTGCLNTHWRLIWVFKHSLHIIMCADLYWVV